MKEAPDEPLREVKDFVVAIPLEADFFNFLMSEPYFEICGYDLDVNTLEIRMHFKKEEKHGNPEHYTSNKSWKSPLNDHKERYRR